MKNHIGPQGELDCLFSQGRHIKFQNGKFLTCCKGWAVFHLLVLHVLTIRWQSMHQLLLLLLLLHLLLLFEPWIGVSWALLLYFVDKFSSSYGFSALLIIIKQDKWPLRELYGSVVFMHEQERPIGQWKGERERERVIEREREREIEWESEREGERRGE